MSVLLILIGIHFIVRGQVQQRIIFLVLVLFFLLFFLLFFFLLLFLVDFGRRGVLRFNFQS